MEKNKIEENVAYAVNSPSKNVTFNFYQACKSASNKFNKKYCVQDSGLKEIKHFDSFKQAKNYARYCAAAVCEYLNGQFEIGDEFTHEDLSERLNNIASNFGIFEEDTRYLFVKEHGYGPSLSYKAMNRSGIMGWDHQIRWENINTDVIFESREDALRSLNNYISISDWETHDWKFEATA